MCSREGDIGNFGAGADVYRPTPSLLLQPPPPPRLYLAALLPPPFIFPPASCLRWHAATDAGSGGRRGIKQGVERLERREREGSDGEEREG